MNPYTGHIIANCTDWRLAAVAPVTALFQLVLGNSSSNKPTQQSTRMRNVMVSNGWNSAFEHQSMNVLRFAETGGVFDPQLVQDAHMPPLVPALMGGHLTTPLALSDITAQGKITEPAEYARFIMKSVLLHLRHGLLFGARALP
jgi:hypothetical protein